MYYIYALVDPITNETKYIGQTNDLKKRYKQHLHPISEKSIWIHNLRRKSKKPKLSIIEEFKSDELVNERELYWINFYKQKKAKLLNGKYLHPRKKYDIINHDEIIADELKKRYELIKRESDYLAIDDLLHDLYYQGWIPAVRTQQKTIWVRNTMPR